MSSFSNYYCYEIVPTLDGVKRDIHKIIGLTEIKQELEAIVEKIEVVEKQASYGRRVVSPKPFHMVFVGNCGTGKSTVAEILAKLFYLAGGLPSYSVTEMAGRAGKIKTAEGGILLLDVDQEEYTDQVLEEIISTMDKGKTSVIFAGSRKKLNSCMKRNKDLFKRFSVRLQFNDLSCEELAKMLHQKMKENNFTAIYKLDSSCSVEMVAGIIAEETCETLRSKLNGYLVGQILEDAKNCLKSRVDSDVAENDQTTITLGDLLIGVRNAIRRYMESELFLNDVRS